ncbi:hypothetical protein [Neptuniibacter sp. QD37_11]|uniref:hypothetical protein n=1 Tax=Neptuniibacter sp. QD37_11 TaxID=3398209 RepID=UPI0039F495D3
MTTAIEYAQAQLERQEEIKSALIELVNTQKNYADMISVRRVRRNQVIERLAMSLYAQKDKSNFTESDHYLSRALSDSSVFKVAINQDSVELDENNNITFLKVEMHLQAQDVELDWNADVTWKEKEVMAATFKVADEQKSLYSDVVLDKFYEAMNEIVKADLLWDLEPPIDPDSDLATLLINAAKR